MGPGKLTQQDPEEREGFKSLFSLQAGIYFFESFLGLRCNYRQRLTLSRFAEIFIEIIPFYRNGKQAWSRGAGGGVKEGNGVVRTRVLKLGGLDLT